MVPLIAMQELKDTKWQLTEVVSPNLPVPTQVIAAKNILYLPHGNRFQTLNIYLPKAVENQKLIGTPVTSLPSPDDKSLLPYWHIHVHGGAWRDPNLTASSIEPTVAYEFSPDNASFPIVAIASINYTLSPFPTHPIQPYDPVKDNHLDLSREALHPQHVRDVLAGFQFLESMGLKDDSYILSGHSAGACLCSQAIFQPAEYWATDSAPPPRPAAFLGLNGLYDLPALVDGLGASHQHLKDAYENLLGYAFGTDKSKWPAASSTRFELSQLDRQRVEGRAPRLVVLDQSKEDQPVPMNQAERLEKHLSKVEQMRVVRGNRCAGLHAAPWEEGGMIWESIRDVLELLGEG
ncbi:hypothetical protein B0J14DRAFT_150003 [Halenospora varia]|nr:hypothetical protein B0J14DRAFT_150003 [Halenospora varia]